MSSQDKSKVWHVLGGGLVGSLAAAVLAQRGHAVELWERRSDPRLGLVERGRSINLAISERGFKALELIGMRSTVMEAGIPMRGRMIHGLDGTTRFSSYDPQGERAIYSIERHRLNCMLLDAASALPNVTMHFDRRLTDLDLHGRCLRDQNDHVWPMRGPVLATDGAGSLVRTAIGHARGTATNIAPLSHSYKELTLLADCGLERHALHIWPRKALMLIALPNGDGTFTCTLFLANEGLNSFSDLAESGRMAQFFASQFPDFPLDFQEAEKQLTANPLGHLATVRCPSWSFEDVLILGDAAHAIVPFFGQGMNAGFEDVRLLAEMLKEPPHRPPPGTSCRPPPQAGEVYQRGSFCDVFSLFERNRKPDVDAIANMALDNFIEMRDRVADPVHMLHRVVESRAERELHGQYVSRYSLVSFSNVPYREAEERGIQNQKTLEAVCKNISDPDDVDLTVLGRGGS